MTFKRAIVPYDRLEVTVVLLFLSAVTLINLRRLRQAEVDETRS